MSDLNLNDDLLNYELGDDIDDQALYGADEDELLLSDDELEKDVTKEVKQQIKAEAEQWVKERIQEKEVKKNGSNQVLSTGGVSTHSKPNKGAGFSAKQDTIEVTSTAANYSNVRSKQTYVTEHVSTSESSMRTHEGFKEPSKSKVGKDTPQAVYPIYTPSPLSNTTKNDEVTSSSSKEAEIDHSSMISCSTGNLTDSSFIQSSQESLVLAPLSASDFSDPREDMEDERETRTNIKTTNERDFESVINDTAEKHQSRFAHSKRGGNPLLRPHTLRGSYHGQRPLLRYPPSHGQFPLQQPPLPYAPLNTTLAQSSSNQGHIGPQSQNPNPSIPLHQHDPMNPLISHRPRHPYPGFRPGGPMSFRHPNSTNMFPQAQHDFNTGNAIPFNPNFGHMPHPSRAMFRPELGGAPMQGGNTAGICPPGVSMGLRPNMRLTRPHLSNLPPQALTPNFINNPAIRPPQQQPLQPPQAPIQLTQGGVHSHTGALPSQISGNNNSGPVASTTMRPNKVLINPNFKGGVQAATDKFIKETQFMSTISSHVSHLQSDDELLRQQEEFINKNREHIEKRRHERSPLTLRRSRSRSRTHSRERSFTPPNKRAGGATGGAGLHFDREREHRERERERERDRERDRDRLDRERDRDRERERERGPIDRERSGFGNGSSNLGPRGNRFRRGNSRDRDYDKRGASNYGKRRRSLSPLHRLGGNSRRGGDRDRLDAEEDEETRAYRLEIEKQKALREKILKDKELKRRRAAEEKQYEDYRTTQPNNNNNNNSNNVTNSTNNEDQSQQHQTQKLKPIVVTERKIISLKKRQQQTQYSDEELPSQKQPQQQESQKIQSQSHNQRKQIPTAKILPEAKRNICEHLAHVSSSGGGNSGSSGNSSSNTAIIKPVQKKETLTPTPPPATVLKQSRRLSSPSADEVELDYDEDELMLEMEDRLLATPTPSPPPRRPVSRTPSPEPTAPPSQPTKTSVKSSRNSSHASSQRSSTSAPFSSSNRRVVLKSSSSTSTGGGSRKESEIHSSDNSRNRRTGGGNSRSSSRKGIFDRLDSRRHMYESGGNNRDGGGGNDGKRSKGQRIVLKHD